MLDIARNCSLLLFWGCDPETTPWGVDGIPVARLRRAHKKARLVESIVRISGRCRCAGTAGANEWLACSVEKHVAKAGRVLEKLVNK